MRRHDKWSSTPSFVRKISTKDNGWSISWIGWSYIWRLSGLQIKSSRARVKILALILVCEFLSAQLWGIHYYYEIAVQCFKVFNGCLIITVKAVYVDVYIHLNYQVFKKDWFDLILSELEIKFCNYFECFLNYIISIESTIKIIQGFFYHVDIIYSLFIFDVAHNCFVLLNNL